MASAIQDTCQHQPAPGPQGTDWVGYPPPNFVAPCRSTVVRAFPALPPLLWTSLSPLLGPLTVQTPPILLGWAPALHGLYSALPLLLQFCLTAVAMPLEEGPETSATAPASHPHPPSPFFKRSAPLSLNLHCLPTSRPLHALFLLPGMPFLVPWLPLPLASKLRILRRTPGGRGYCFLGSSGLRGDNHLDVTDREE